MGLRSKHEQLVHGVGSNGRMLATFADTGELLHLFWPHVDYPQHVNRLVVGLCPRGAGNPTPTHWFAAEQGWETSQKYEADGPVLCTRAEASGTTIRSHDFVIAGSLVGDSGEIGRLDACDLLVRRYRVQLSREAGDQWSFLLYSAFQLEESPLYNTAFFDPQLQALVFYRRNTWVAVGANRSPSGYACGEAAGEASAWTDAQDGRLDGGPIRMGDVDGALSWHVETEAWELALFICFGPTRESAQELLAAARAAGADKLQSAVNAEWNEWLSTYAAPGAPVLWRRSLSVMRMMTDAVTGAMIAAPEFDPDRRYCGGYGYTWGRDAAYVVAAMDEVGLTGMARRFYEWAIGVQEPEGVWYQRHYVTGEPAPSWGLIQIDETGSLLWGMHRHMEANRDLALLRTLMPSVSRGAEFMMRFRDPKTGLPAPSVDLWEERASILTYSSAAVYGGLVGAAGMARLAGDVESAARWEKGAREIHAAVYDHLWSDRWGRYLRGLQLALPDGSVKPEDPTVDVSLLGLVVPFQMFDPLDPRIVSTVEAIEFELTQAPAGGIMRYAGDHYRGGNPWVICTFWLATYHARAGNLERAQALVDWAASRQNEAGLLPEQVDRQTGRPAWVVPLTWSHAMYMLAICEIERAKRKEDGVVQAG